MDVYQSLTILIIAYIGSLGLSFLILRDLVETLLELLGIGQACVDATEK